MKKTLVVALAMMASLAHAERWVHISDSTDIRIGFHEWIDVDWTPHPTNQNIRIYNKVVKFSDQETSHGIFEIDCKLLIEHVAYIKHANSTGNIIGEKKNTNWLSFNLFKNSYMPYQLICNK